MVDELTFYISSEFLFKAFVFLDCFVAFSRGDGELVFESALLGEGDCLFVFTIFLLLLGFFELSIGALQLGRINLCVVGDRLGGCGGFNRFAGVYSGTAGHQGERGECESRDE